MKSLKRPDGMSLEEYGERVAFIAISATCNIQALREALGPRVEERFQIEAARLLEMNYADDVRAQLMAGYEESEDGQDTDTKDSHSPPS